MAIFKTGNGESGSREIRESGNPRIGESENRGIRESGNPRIGESENRGIVLIYNTNYFIFKLIRRGY